MDYANMIKLAILYAYEKHKGQTRLDGTPYIEHPRRVANSLSEPIERIAALLHDTIEDTDTTYENILSIFGVEVADIVRLLSRSENETYSQFIDRLIESNNIHAIRIKIADINDNLSDLDKYPEKQGLSKRYNMALQRLTRSTI